MPETLEQPQQQPALEQLPAWSEVSEDIRTAFPNADHSAVQRAYEGVRDVNQWHGRLNNAQENLTSYWLRRAPFTQLNRRNATAYHEANERMNSGNPRAGDAETIAVQERLRFIDQDRQSTTGGAVTEAFSHVPGMIGEQVGLSIAGRLVGLGRGGAAAGGAAAPILSRAGLAAMGRGAATRAAMTPLMPSMYERQAIAANEAAGRHPTDIRGFPAAVTMGALQNAVIGSLGPAGNAITGEGIRPVAARLLARTGIGMGEMQGVRVLASAVSEALPEAYRLDTGYGVLGSAFRGEWGQAWREVAVDMAVFSAFAGLHEAQTGAPQVRRAGLAASPEAAPEGPRAGPEPSPGPRGGGEPQARQTPQDMFRDAMNRMHQQGVPRDRAATILKEAMWNAQNAQGEVGTFADRFRRHLDAAMQGRPSQPTAEPLRSRNVEPATEAAPVIARTAQIRPGGQEVTLARPEGLARPETPPVGGLRPTAGRVDPEFRAAFESANRLLRSEGQNFDPALVLGTAVADYAAAHHGDMIVAPRHDGRWETLFGKPGGGANTGSIYPTLEAARESVRRSQAGPDPIAGRVRIINQDGSVEVLEPPSTVRRLAGQRRVAIPEAPGQTVETTMGGRPVTIQMARDGNAVKIDFGPVPGQLAGVSRAGLQKGTLALAKDLMQIARTLKESGTAIVYDTNQQRHKGYTPGLERTGYELVGSEPIPGRANEQRYTWVPKEVAQTGLKTDSGKSGLQPKVEPLKPKQSMVERMRQAGKREGKVVEQPAQPVRQPVAQPEFSETSARIQPELTEAQRMVWDRRHAEKPASLRTLAAEMGVSHEQVRKIEKQAAEILGRQTAAMEQAARKAEMRGKGGQTVAGDVREEAQEKLSRSEMEAERLVGEFLASKPQEIEDAVKALQRSGLSAAAARRRAEQIAQEGIRLADAAEAPVPEAEVPQAQVIPPAVQDVMAQLVRTGDGFNLRHLAEVLEDHFGFPRAAVKEAVKSAKAIPDAPPLRTRASIMGAQRGYNAHHEANLARHHAIEGVTRILEGKPEERVVPGDADEEFIDATHAAVKDFVLDESGSATAPTLESLRETAREAGAVIQYVRDAVQRYSGRMFPTSTRSNREAGEALARHAVSRVFAKEASTYYGNIVMGPDSTKAEDILVGAVLTERRLRYMRQAFAKQAETASTMAAVARQTGDKEGAAKFAREATEALRAKNNVTTLIGKEGSPFKTLEDYRAALQHPLVDQAMRRWNNELVPIMNEQFRLAQGMAVDDPIISATQIPGSPVNLKPILGDEPIPASAVFTSSQGNLRNPRARKLKFSIKATGAADAYDIDVRNMIEGWATHAIPLAAQANMYRVMESAGLMKWGKEGRGAEFDGKRGVEIPNVRPPAGTQAAQLGETSAYFDPRVAGEVRDSLAVDAVQGYQKAMQIVNEIPTIASLAAFGDETAHAINLMGAMFAPRMVRSLPRNLWGAASGTWLFRKVFGKTYAQMQRAPYDKRLLELARIGAQKHGGLEAGILTESINNLLSVTGRQLPEGAKMFDPTHHVSGWLDGVAKMVRLTAADAYDSLVKSEMVPATETGKRDFVNQLTGQYEKKAQNGLVRWLRNTKFGPFATAGTTMTMRAMRMLVGSPGVPATSNVAALRMRANTIGKLIAILSGVAALNYFLWKRWDGDDDVPFGAIKVGETPDGRSRYLGTPTTAITRGLRATGAMAVIEGSRKDRSAGETTDRAIRQIVNTQLYPTLGPGYQFGHTVMTGKNTFGIQIADRAPRGQSQMLQNVEAAALAANPIVSAVTGYDVKPNERRDRRWYEGLSNLGGPFAPRTSLTGR